MTLPPGFADPVGDAQRVFRDVLDAMAHPGRIVALRAGPPAPAPLVPAAAAVCLALLDHDTPLWVDPGGWRDEALDYLRFHCGVPLVGSPREAAFALCSDAASLPDPDELALGTDEYPDRSTTLIVQVPELSAGRGPRLTGPGIDGASRLEVGGRPERVWRVVAANPSLFPRGVDLILAAGARVAALPRTTRVGGLTCTWR